MKNNKELYFIPKIEDIHVGYQCQKRKCDKNPDSEYIDTIIWAYDIPNIKTHIGLRTAYLTKEDIESQGFKEIHQDEYLSLDGKLHFTNGRRETETGDITEYYSCITNKYNNSYIKNVLFEGTIRCINDFKTVMRLLNRK